MSVNRRQFLAGSLSGLAAFGAPADTFDQRARALLAQMTLEEKIGQMTQPDQRFVHNLEDVEKYNFGSVLSGGDSDPASGNDLGSWTDLYDRFQSRTLKTRLRIPLLYGVDAVHGHNNVIGAVIFPHNIGLGCANDEALVESAGRITAEEVRATGMNWAFAPCVAVPQDIRWGRTYEAYGESPDIVKKLGAAAVRGLQRDSLANPLAVLACAKHFAADGGTAMGTGRPSDQANGQRFLDQGDTRVDEATLRRIHLPGYVTTVAAGVGSIMPSYSSWNGLKCSGQERLLTGILKRDFGFAGFLISDYGAVDQLPGTYKQQVRQSINAGMDMVMIPERYPEFCAVMKELVAEGGVPLSRVDDAVIRILRVKFAMGLMDPNRSLLADRRLHKTFGSSEHRAAARQCVRQSLVILKNDRRALPMARNMRRIHVAGASADDIGNQCGGWTIRWQGQSGDITKGTTLLAALRRRLGAGTEVTHSPDGSGAGGATVGLVVIGETPSAETAGDRASLPLAAEDVAAVDRVKSAGIPVVVLIFSGRPMMIDAILSKADAIVAAWLPGTEGDGLVDVLLGDFNPTGKLSFTWPRGDSTSLHRGDAGYKTLFPLGYGLTY